MAHKNADKSSIIMSQKISKCISNFLTHEFTISGAQKNASIRTKYMVHKISVLISLFGAHKISISRTHRNSNLMGQRPLRRLIAHSAPAHRPHSARSSRE